MRKYLISKFCLFTSILYLSLAMISCSSAKKIKYFDDIPDSGQLANIGQGDYTPPKIQTDDLLTVILQTADPLASQIVNIGNVSVAGSGNAVGTAVPSSQILSGYLVDENGEINMPIIGKVKVAGYTTTEAGKVINDLASKLYKNPTVIVRYANFKISVTGEVLHPGQYIVPNEKVNILDGLAMAGDLTIYGKRDNVLLIRENADGTKTPYRVNLTKSNIMTSNFYYLRQNDIIYVEPSKAKSAATDITQAKTLAIIGTALSLLIVLVSRMKF